MEVFVPQSRANTILTVLQGITKKQNREYKHLTYLNDTAQKKNKINPLTFQSYVPTAVKQTSSLYIWKKN